MTRLYFIALLPFAAAAAAALMPNAARRAAALVVGAAALVSLGLLVSLWPAVSAGEVPQAAIEWLPGLGVSFGYRVDGLAFIFAAMVTAIGALVTLYALYYLDPSEAATRFFALLAAFMGAMLGLVMANNLILLVVYWEMTSLASFMLIGFWTHEAAARRGARMALAVTGAGGLALFGGVLLIGHMAGSYQLDAVLGAAERLHAHPLYLPALLLVLAGAFTKSAQFPFHFWLPHAMAAPTPVSAYLHSATMVKAGVFLLARLHPSLAGSEPWFFIVSGVGLVTLVTAALIAVFQHDLKGLLAYSTISHLGLITLLFGLDSPLAAVAGVFHILNHAVFKASLFMATGIIDHECGSRDMRRINGLWRFMPYTATLAMTAAAAMAGVPLMNGFLSKEMFFAETLFVEGHLVIEIATPLAALAAGAFAVAYSMRFVHDVFFNGEPRGLDRVPHEPPRWMKLPVELLVLICLAVGLFPAQTIGPLLEVGSKAVLNGAVPEFSLAVWHGFNAPLAMSLLAFALGIGFYFALQRLFRLHDMLHRRPGGREAFDWLLARATGAARTVMTTLATGRLQGNLAVIVVAAVAALAVPLVSSGVGTVSTGVTAANPLAFAVWAIGIAAALATVTLHRRRFVALILLGVVGLMVTLTFAGLSAPDLALTQLLVEVVSIILMLLALHYLPRESPREAGRVRRLGHLAIAAAAGLAVAALAHAVLTRGSRSISGFFLEKALPEGGGSNVVNVIIVDFRGFDTLGEITVLAVAGLIVFALLKDLLPATAITGTAGSPLLRSAARLLLPLATLVSAYLFLRGHNLPGGGFIAGLVFASALLVLYVANGAAWVEARLVPRWRAWLGAGLLIAAATGAAAAVFGHPFLTSAFAHPVLPGIGEVPIASAMFFDLGVFLTVVGATMLALVMLGRLSADGVVR